MKGHHTIVLLVFLALLTAAAESRRHLHKLRLHNPHEKAFGRRQGSKSRLVEGLPSEHAARLRSVLPSFYTGELPKVDACVQAAIKTKPRGRPLTVMITSTSGPYMLGSKGRAFRNTIWSKEDSKVHAPLWVRPCFQSSRMVSSDTCVIFISFL
jgi:hypothetical protein